MRRSYLIILLSISLNFLFAQDNDADRVRRSILALERKIEQVAMLAERYNNQEALRIVGVARQELQEAVSFLQEKRYILARTKYLSADKKADLAARLLLFKPTANLKTELERLIHQAESVSHKVDTSELRYFLNKARAFHRDALSAFAQSRYLKGHEYLKIAIYFAEKTISLAKSNQDGNNRLQKFEEQKNNIQILLNQAARSHDENPVLTELYQSAQNYLKKALTAYNNGNYERAYSQLQIAERLIYRIIDLSDNKKNTDEDRLKDDYLSLGRYLNSVRNELEGADQQSKLLDRAENIYALAGRNLSSGQYEKTATNLKLSQRMAMRAFKKLSSDSRPDSENLQNRINEIQHLLQLQDERISESSNNSLKSLYDQAVKLLKQAEEAFANQQYAQTSYLLNLTLRILNRNEKLFREQTKKNISLQDLRQDLVRIEQIFSRLKENTSLKNKVKIRLNYLAELLVKARSDFEKNNLIVTREILFIIQQQLSTLLKK